jgi:hypothetical protein
MGSSLPPVNITSVSLQDPSGVPIGRGNALAVRDVRTVVLPFRKEAWTLAYTGSSSAGATLAPAENFTSAGGYDSGYMGGGYDLPLSATVNASNPAAFMAGVAVSGYFDGSVFGLVRYILNAATDNPAYPFTAVIDGVAFQADPRTPWIDYPVQAAMDSGLKYQRLILARGLHSGRHRVVLHFPMDPAGVTNRSWRFEALVVEETETQRAPPAAEIFQNAQTIALSTSSTSPTLVAIRGATAPGVLAIRNIFLSNPTGSAAQVFWRPNLPNGPGASSPWLQRTLAAGDGDWLFRTDAPKPQEIQLYGSAANLLAAATYWR